MRFLVVIAVIVILTWVNLKSGSSGWIADNLLDIIGGEESLAQTLVFDIRLPALLTAIVSGAGLALAGLMMQVLFQNQLAGPGIMGVSSGGALAVSIALLTGIGSASLISIFSMVGSISVLLIILMASLRFRSNSSVLILGLMLGYLISALISTLEYSAEAEQLQQFIFWTMGSYASVTWSELPLIVGLISVVTVLSYMYRSRLDEMLLGEDHMLSLGMDIKKWRVFFFVLIGVLVGVVTAFCGPLVFIGLASAHVARIFTASDIHAKMIPTVLGVGVILSLLALYLVNAPWVSFNLPLNAVLSIFGAPVVIYLLIKRPSISHDS